jgi:hypothetical protein
VSAGLIDAKGNLGCTHGWRWGGILSRLLAFLYHFLLDVLTSLRRCVVYYYYYLLPLLFSEHDSNLI